ncbi:glycosyltransferase [Variovorax robiniae]|uniref:Glycosyltransferase n=1 Tax=Variovorax robiniae TaxID=1836199 RepID=A0ABU8X6N5_9BURK
MKIVIDMQGAQTESRYRGIGRYTIEFARAIIRNSREHEIILALNGLFPSTIEPIRAAFNDLLPQDNIRVWYTPGPVAEAIPNNNKRRRAAELLRESFLKSLRADVIHIPSLFEGYGDDAVTSIGRLDVSTKVSITLYDLIPLLNPEQYLAPNPSYSEYYHRKLEYAKRAALYLTISESSTLEAIEHLSAQSRRVFNTSVGIDPAFRPTHIGNSEQKSLRQRFLLTKPFVLYAGGGDKRKNLHRLIMAFCTMPESLRNEYQLLLVGKIDGEEIEKFKRIAETQGLQDQNLRFAGYVNETDLISLYNLCELFVFPSWHEGFGLPAVEAMACGAPVIGACTSSVPEAIGLQEALFDPFDINDISQKMGAALQDGMFRNVLREHGLQQAKKFSWDETAQKALLAWTTVSAHQAPLISPSKKKKRLAYVSPLPPERTGIADYSAELVPSLAKHYEIELIVAQDSTNISWAQQYGSLRDVAWLRANASKLDRVLYHVGNSPFHQHMLGLLEEIPGVIVLHDFYLSSLMHWCELTKGDAHAWTSQLYLSHGYEAVRLRYRAADRATLVYPVNWSVVRGAQGVIVHSEYSRTLARDWYGANVCAAWKVIPHLRASETQMDKAEARRELGIGQGDFLVCSFGFMAPTKFNHRLLEAWINSPLASDERCRLVFVGENDGGNYGALILEKICGSGCAHRINITGFASTKMFHQYLAAADLAVQLRVDSRGETSGTVLDCMNNALPVIVNANGSFAELDREAVWMLPDAFDDNELIAAMEKLWRDVALRDNLGHRARQVISKNHAPIECAQQYADAIESFFTESKADVPTLIDAIANEWQSGASDDADLQALASAIAASFPVQQPAKSLYLDVTATCSNDLNTGIERVARALTMILLGSPLKGYRTEPVYLSQAGGRWHYRHARRYTLGLLGCPQDALTDETVAPQCGDMLVGLDISGDTMIRASQAGLHAEFRAQGCKVYFMVYDLLPVYMPQVFPPGADKGHEDWLRSVAAGDGAICISRTVADDLNCWLREKGDHNLERRPFRVMWSHLGADVESSAPSSGLPGNAGTVLAQIGSRPSFLMVGTIEPRKGYLQVIKAFSRLWDNGVDINLIIVGREGWKDLPQAMRRNIPETVEQLRNHPELETRLLWLDGISDEYLELVYAASTCLIAASYGEGFGLPLIEAAQKRLPIVARDIPVFREVAGSHAHYFQGEDGDALADAILDWLALHADGKAPLSDQLPWLTWGQSARSLIYALDLGQGC